ncbi:MAG: DUF1080 domain-containing protein [Proteobacteria bacterium]|nr:DUF1080 domain-containing protein [Pseudomonadota bacterium]
MKTDFINLICLVISIGGLMLSGGLSAAENDIYDNGFISIFDGESLKGWEGDQLVWKTSGGSLTVGSADKKLSGNTFLINHGMYKDFELKIKFKYESPDSFFNAGILFRCEPGSEKSEAKGYRLTLCKTETDKMPGVLLHDEKEGMVLVNKNPVEAMPTRWNEVRILCTGARIQTWINDIKTADHIEDDKSIKPEGQIAFYADKTYPGTLMFSDIRIKRFSKPVVPLNEWEDLLDEKLSKWDIAMGVPRAANTEGFTHPIPKENTEALKAWDYAFKHKKPIGIGKDYTKEFTTFTNDDSEVVLRLDGGIKGFLATKKPYKNYHFKALYRWPDVKENGGQGGIFYHSKELAGSNRRCIEYQYRFGDFGSLVPLIGASAVMKTLDPLKSNGETPNCIVYDPRGEKRILIKNSQEKDYTRRGKGYGFRNIDYEKPIGEWNVIEYYCLDDRAIHVVNGHVVCAVESFRDEVGNPLIEGLILLESEYKGGFYKQIKIRSIDSFPEVYKLETGL